jgi:hypothetical protein
VRRLAISFVLLLSICSVVAIEAPETAADAPVPVAPAPAAPVDPKPPPRPVGPIATENDALALALADLKTLPPHIQPLVRYIWVTPFDPDGFRILSDVVNKLSRASLIVRPVVLGQGRLMLVRIDLSIYAPKAADLKEWIELWELLEFDPRFSKLITQDTLKFLAGPEQEDAKKNLGGKRTEKKTEKKTVKKTIPNPKAAKKAAPTPTPTPDDDPRARDPLWKEWLAATDTYGMTFDEWRASRANQRKGKSATKAKQPKAEPKTVIIDEPESNEPATIEVVEEVSQDVVVEVIDPAKVDVIRLPAGHLDAKVLGELTALTHSQAPVVSSGYFLSRALDTIQDAGLYKTIWGGLYYEFVGFKTAKEGTDLDLIFQDFIGIGNIKGGVSAEQFYDQLRSDQRIAIFISGVTGKPRRIDFAHGPQSRDTQGSWALTRDLRDQDVDIRKHPILNILSLQPFAFELIFDGVNGEQKYAIFNAEKRLAREVPPDVAADHDAPAPWTKRLRPAVSCIRCHGIKGEGWQSSQNDAAKLVASNRSFLKVLGDLSDLKASPQEVRDRVQGLFGGDAVRWVRRARDDYNSVVLQATGPWPEDAAKAQANTVKITSSAIAREWERYWYTPIDAAAALADLGVESKEPVADLRKLLLPDPQAAVDGELPEDPRIGGLLDGLRIGRADYSLVCAFIAERAAKNRAVRPAPLKK